MSSTSISTDPLSQEFMRCPFEGLAELRRSDPVHKVPGLDLYMVTKYDDVVAVLRDTKTFSNTFDGCEPLMAQIGLAPPAPTAPDVREIRSQCPPMVAALLKSDPPKHTGHRRLVNRFFTNRAVEERWMPVIERITDELLSGMERRGEADLLKEFAVPLPVRVIAETLGLPPERMADFKRWSVAVESSFGLVKTHDEWITAATAERDMRNFLMDVVRSRLDGEPRDDLIGALVTAHLEQKDDPAVEDPVTLEEIMEIVRSLLAAGNITTTQLIAETVNKLFDHPEHLLSASQDPATIPAIIEEVLRLDGPTIGLYRRATTDATVGGTVIPQGALVIVYFGSASNDEQIFDAPHEFRPGRDNGTHHMAFGHGIHMCPGAPLARAEARVALTRLLERLPGLRRAPGTDAEYLPNFLTRRTTSLRAEWDR